MSQTTLPPKFWFSCYCLVAKLYLILLRHNGLQPARLLCPWDFPGKSTGVGCHFLLQGIFLTQGLNPHLLHWQVDSLPLSHQRSPSSGLDSISGSPSHASNRKKVLLFIYLLCIHNSGYSGQKQFGLLRPQQQTNAGSCSCQMQAPGRAAPEECRVGTSTTGLLLILI